MDRKITEQLYAWFYRKDRKPLILRGARQVGKTWIVRYLASKLNLDLIELNFERDTKFKTVFKDNDTQKIILQLELLFNKTINPKQTLLFLDEIQAAPELLAKLRWFAEEKPELAIIATGSLLDFALDMHEFSVPVGRINYMYLEPMSFEEFLLAKNEAKLCEFLSNFELKNNIPENIHDKLNQLLREYAFVGGLPAAVDNWIQNRTLITVNEIHHNILQAYRDDFSKYAKRISIERLDDIFRSIPKMLGKKFKYSLVNTTVRSESLKDALNLLCKARVCHKVLNTSASGIPIDTYVKENIFKVIFLDIGLVFASMGLTFSKTVMSHDFKLNNEGGLAEQLAGQLLRTTSPHYMNPKLYYWVREKKGAESEIDYLMQYNSTIIPIEVKAGATGTLRSLHTFMKEKGLKKAIRLNTDYPSVVNVKVKDIGGELLEYELTSLPMYLTEQIHRFG